MASADATCPLCDVGLDEMPGWDRAPETAVARHLISVHEGWERELGLFAEVLGELGEPLPSGMLNGDGRGPRR